jgi:hypothetical protein
LARTTSLRMTAVRATFGFLPAAMRRRAIVFATVAGDRREARDHRGLLGRQGADLAQSGDQRDRGDRSDAGNRGENIKTPGEDGIAGDQAA